MKRLALVPGATPQKSADVSPVVERVSEKIRTLAAVKPALVRLLEWQIDAALEYAETERNGRG